MPVGTLLIKEFWMEREPGVPASAFIVETRFLVKRCEPGNCRAAWQGYSYQWDDEGTEAQLLDNTSDPKFKDWPLASGMHQHTYPGRDQCTQCHALAAGGTLGLQSMQFDRNFDYGDGVDNQLRALGHVGLFGDDVDVDVDVDPLPGTDQAPLPNPADPSFSDEQRSRAYFHANCSHCHRPDGEWPVIDFQYDAPLVAADDSDTNICNLVVPGDAQASELYIKDSTRVPDLPPGFDGDPMPPLGTLLPDAGQLAIMARWIEGMTSCP
jgi:mono/diheme cytochrome c family protein